MRHQGINQWNQYYPLREDFIEDIEKGQLFVGMAGQEIAVIYTLNQEYDKEYETASWSQPEKSFFIVHRLCVHPKFQHQGIARQTMEEIERTASLHGVPSIRLDVYSKNPYALKLYHSCGYQEVGTITRRNGMFYFMELYI
ncbi:MAG: GNAT family N-acetyltransferase [Lachnospiraceae bacterium]|nr:GNAT family N-acetyltransferase [Lachnospiraceae bacterium]